MRSRNTSTKIYGMSLNITAMQSYRQYHSEGPEGEGREWRTLLGTRDCCIDNQKKSIGERSFINNKGKTMIENATTTSI
jgi:hypothetical protein